MRISDWSSDVCSSDLVGTGLNLHRQAGGGALLAQQPADLVGDIAHVDQAFVEFVMSCLDLRKIENVVDDRQQMPRSEEHTSELQSLMRISYAVFCLKKKKKIK